MTRFFLKIFGLTTLFVPHLSTGSLAILDISPPPLERKINQKEIEKKVSAKSFLIFDVTSSSIILAKNAHQKLPVASLNKLMSTLLILEENTPYQVVKISKQAAATLPAKMWLLENEKIYVNNLLRGLLIASANDAAVALATFNAGSINSFVEKMNIRAKNLGLKNSHFQNPHGLDSKNNFSSSYDIAFLASFLWQKKHPLWGRFFQETVKTKEITVKSTNQQIEHPLHNTNELLNSNLPIFGIKTGTTDLAGQCLVTLFRKNKREILIVVLNSQDRFLDTKILFNSI